MAAIESLDASKDAALHQQLYALLRNLIESGGLTVGQKLASERQLAAEHGVSRTTIRQALRWLASDGLVYARPGSGYFVALPSTESHIKLRDTAENLQAEGLPYVTRVLQRQIIRVDINMAQNLSLLEGENAILLQLLYTVHNDPICIETFYLPYALFPAMLNLEITSVYAALEEHYALRISHGAQTVQAMLASPEECEILQSPPPLSVLVVRRRTFDIHHKLIMYSVNVCVGKRYPFRMTLRRE